MIVLPTTSLRSDDRRLRSGLIVTWCDYAVEVRITGGSRVSFLPFLSWIIVGRKLPSGLLHLPTDPLICDSKVSKRAIGAHLT